MTAERFALVAAGRSMPIRVAEGAATLPRLFSTVSNPDTGLRRVAVAVGSVASHEDAVGLLVIHPVLTGLAEGFQNRPTVVSDRWSGNEVVAGFTREFRAGIRSSRFVHARVTVPRGDATDLPGELLQLILLLERIGVFPLGDVSHLLVDETHVSASTRSTSADGYERALQVSIVTSNAEPSNARIDFHGSEQISTIIVPDRGAGAAAGTAFSVTSDGQRTLPSRFVDPIRTALLELHGLMGTDQTGPDLDRLERSIRETTRLLDVG